MTDVYASPVSADLNLNLDLNLQTLRQPATYMTCFYVQVPILGWVGWWVTKGPKM